VDANLEAQGCQFKVVRDCKGAQRVFYYLTTKGA